MEEGGVGLGVGEQPAAQLLGEFLDAVERAEVEEDRRVEQCLGSGSRIQEPKRFFHSARVRHSSGLLAMMLPLHSGKPQAARSSLTLRAKAINFSFVGFLRDALREHIDQTVVLVGGQRLLVAPFGAEGKPGELRVMQLVAIDAQFDDAAGEGVIERRNEAGELLGTDPRAIRLRASWRMSRLACCRASTSLALSSLRESAANRCAAARTGRARRPP